MAVESFKNITMTFEGIGLNAIIDKSTVAQYSNSIKGLTLEQANLALSTTQLSATEKERVLVEAGLIAQTETLTATDAVYRLQQKLGNDLSAKEILISAGLVTQKEIENGTTIKLTADKLKEALATGQLSLENYKLIASIFGVEGANYGSAVSFDVLTKAIWANIKALAKWLVTTPAGWATLAVAAIAGVVSAINGYNDSLNEAKEKIAEQAQSAKELSDDLFDLRKQYITLSKEVETDKSKKEQLTSVTEELLKKLGYEKETVGDLVKEYGNLDNAINNISLSALQEAESSLKIDYGNKKRALARDKEWYANALMWLGASDSYGFYAQPGYTNFDIAETLKDSGIFKDDTRFDYNSSRINLKGSIYSVDEMKQNYKDISDALTLLNSKFETDVLENDNIFKTLQAKQEELKTLIDDYDTSVSNLNSNLAQQQIITSLQGKELPKTKEEFDSFVDSVINASIASEKFIGSEEDIKDTITSFMSTMPEFSSFFNIDDVITQPAEEQLNSLIASLSEFKEACKTAFDSQSKIQSAFDKIKEGSVLTADEVRNLIDTLSEVYPEISTLFTKVGDGYTISLEDLVSANDAITGELKSSIENRIAELENTRKKAETLVASPIAKETIKSTTTEIKSLTTVLSMIGLTVESSDDKAKQLAETYKELSSATSTLVGKAKTVSSAFAEQNENGKLSAETVLSLIENGYAAALMYDKKTGTIRLNAQAYLELANAEIEQQRIELEIAKETALQDKLDAEREIVSNLGWSYLGAAGAAVEWEKVQKRIADDNADVSKYDAMLASLMEFKGNLGDIINGNYGNTGGNTEDLNKKLFEQEKALRQHWLAMGKDDKGKKYTEDMYYAWLDSADGYKKYFSDLEKYLDENRQYEEEVYKWKLERDKQFFQEKLDNYNKLADTELNDKEYDDPLQKYRNAATIIGEAITATQNRINDLVATGSSAVQDEIDDLTDKLGDLNEKLAEINDDLWDTRVDNEKEFWEQQKEAVKSYYDNEIKKLQDIEDEQEKINKQEELRLNLLKAQQELLDAKKNRNQLVFHNGTFEYMYDQEKVESAQENLKNAQDDIAKNQRQESIKLLEEQRDNALEFYDKILNMIEAYINKTLPVEASDPEVLGNILNSEYAKAANQETTINNPTSDIKNATKNFKAITLDEFIARLGVTKAQWDKFSESMNIVSGISNMRNSDLLEKVVTNNSYVNSNSNQSNVSVGDIYVTVQGGTSETMINEFAEKLRSKLVTLGIRTQVN